MRRLGLGLRSHYAIAFGMLGTVIPYVSLYLRAARGLNDAQIGWIHAETTVGLLLAPIVTTYLADRWISNRALMGMVYGFGAVGLALLALAESFAGLAGAFLMFALTMASMIPLLNGLAMAALDERPEGAAGSFHRLRVFGTLGFMVPSVGLFVLLQWTPVTTEAAMWMGAAVALAGMINVGGLPAHGGRDNAPQPQPANEPSESNDDFNATGRLAETSGGRGSMPSVDAVKLLFSRSVIGFTLGVFLLSMAGAVFFAFYALYLDELGVEDQWVGLIFNLGVAAEVACILGAGWLRRKIGLRGIMLLGTAAGLVRMGLMAMVPTVPVVILTQLLHGPMILTVVFVPVIYLNEKAEPHFRNSVQGLYTMLCRGLPRLAGSPLGGYLSMLGAAIGSSLFGMQLAFGAAAVLIAVALLVMVVMLREA